LLAFYFIFAQELPHTVILLSGPLIKLGL
jgi:hypothetical protein